MNEKEIKQLLKRYWQCETSLEDERLLQEIFSGNALSGEVKKFRLLVAWKNRQKALRADKNRLVLPEKSKPLALYPVLRIAASVLIVFTIGVGFHTHYQQEKMIDKVLSETFVNPEDTVMRGTGDVVAKVSAKMPTEINDSIE